MPSALLAVLVGVNAALLTAIVFVRLHHRHDTRTRPRRVHAGRLSSVETSDRKSPRHGDTFTLAEREAWLDKTGHTPNPYRTYREAREREERAAAARERAWFESRRVSQDGVWNPLDDLNRRQTLNAMNDKRAPQTPGETLTGAFRVEMSTDGGQTWTPLAGQSFPTLEQAEAWGQNLRNHQPQIKIRATR